jgi:hypothetical protein
MHFNPTWAVELNYHTDLGFSPEKVEFLTISNRAGLYGPKGTLQIVATGAD